MKHPEFILAVKSALLQKMRLRNGFNLIRLDHDLDLATSHLIIGQREALEQDTDFRQLLPYVVITQTDHEGTRRVFSYQRTKGVGENRLLGNHSIGFGGHIDFGDVIAEGEDSIIDLWSTVIGSALRELTEELGLDEAFPDVEFLGEMLMQGAWGTLVDDNNPVGQVHLGLAFHLELDPELTLNCQEDSLQMMPLARPGELLAAHHEGRIVMENWSCMLLLALMRGEGI